MSSRSQLDAYIGRLEGRLRLGALLRGAAILTSAALVTTLLLVLVANHFAFSYGVITGSRIVLLIALAFAVGFGLAVPLYGLDRRSAAGTAEVEFPEFQERLVTFTERDEEGRDPFIELLAADTLSIAQKAEPKRLFSDAKLFASLATGAASLGILIWMIMAGPGYLGHGASLLWLGAEHSGAPLYDLKITPGDITVRRNADQIVTAQLLGVQTDQVHLYARYQSSSKWDQVNMQSQPGSSGFQFLFAGIPQNVEYYVEAGPLSSKHFNIKVADLPSIKGIKVTYHFPSWTGMPAAVEERSGDLSAVEGTQAELELTTDRPLRDGVLVVDDKQLNLSGGTNNVYKGTVQIDKDGVYHVAALDQGQSVRLSDDYFIEASKANPPDVRVLRPGKDYRASPIEEVTVAVNAADEFGLQDMQLHYSVNGGTEYTVPLLKQKGAKEADGSTVISLEPYKLVPGDLVSIYATAKDAHLEARSEMMFIQADPYEREFSQSQQTGGGGGGGGGANTQAEISQREKEIIASTWRQQGEKNVTAQQATETAKFLSDVQAKLHDQALSLSGRLDARELSDENQTFTAFQQDMTAAAEAMQPAADKLGQQKWKDAIPQEQKALQHLLRAEATFKQIQVAFGARGGAAGGGAGGSDSAGRDLASLFDLELDTEKNQYETAQTANADDKKAESIDEALKKLDELEKRQQDLANQPKQNTPESRYQQEMLRRQAEDLQKQVEQMARNGKQGQPDGSAGSSGQPAENGGKGNGQGTPADTRMQQAADQLKQANDDMRRAASPGQDPADARRAAERLKEAENLLGGMQNQQSGQKLSSMAQEGDRISSEQKKQEDELKQAFGGQGASSSGKSQGVAKPEDLKRLADGRQQLGQDLARLEKQMQDAARDMATSGDKAASAKLRDALSQTQQSDLDARIKRSTDWIRRGIDPNSNSGEPAIASDLNRLSDQIHQAQQAAGGGDGKQKGGQEQALDHVDKFRDQMEALSRGLGDRASRNGQQGQSASGQQGQPGQQGQGGGQQGQPGSGKGGQPGQSANAMGDGQGGFGSLGGARAPGTIGGFDTGSFERETGSERAPVPTSQADMDRAYQQAMQELNNLRQSVKDQPEPLSDISELQQELRRLDPKRFPGNPAMLQELHTQVAATVDKLELQLRRQADDQQPGQVRSGDSQPVPPGYADAVAEYFRRLSSKNP